MKYNNLLLACFMILFMGIMVTPNTTMAQCPTCTINLPPGIPVDTILVDTLPPASKNLYYEETMSYRLPHNTDPLAAVAPPGTNVPTGLAIDHFLIQSVTGLPPGLSWTGDRPSPMLYDEVSPTTRDGCITLCGTPGAAGTFIVNVNFEIQILGLVFPSPPIPLEFIVHPDPNAPFSMDTVAGCAPFAVVVNNAITSNGNPNITYSWNFNNGTSSTLESPDTVWYDFSLTADTVVAIEYQAIIDTFPYFLEKIVVVNDGDSISGCGDYINIPLIGIQGNPADRYMILIGAGDTINTDPNFSLFGNTEVDKYFPDTLLFPGPLELPVGQNFDLEVWDDDSVLGPLDADDLCGSGAMVISAALGAGVHTLTSNMMTVEVTISHYIDTVTYVDSVYVRYCNTSISYISKLDRSLAVYPNPTSDLVNVKFNMDGTAQNVELIVTDLLGRAVYNEVLENYGGAYSRQVNLDKQSNGVYILQLRIGKEMLHRKIVLGK
jgi:hypothetical protein